MLADQLQTVDKGKKRDTYAYTFFFFDFEKAFAMG